jgi:uncharacterized protein involved in exopolysaccharide biosynthesis
MTDTTISTDPATLRKLAHLMDATGAPGLLWSYREEIRDTLRAIATEVETLKRENADLTRRLAEVTAERDAEIAGSVELLACHNKQFARAETAEAALSRRDEALRVAREALDTIAEVFDGLAADVANGAISEIDALTKPQEAADAGENG